jgi:endonuclease YncB( thermonuclease family)
MRRSRVLFAWTILGLGFVGCQPASFDESWFEGRCVAVRDGDTIEVRRDGETVRIRLHGIDAPERTQPYSKLARKRTGELAQDQVVRVKMKDRDRYDRIVGRVFVNGQDLSLILVREGLAWHYRYYSSDLRLAFYEFRARQEQLGLWQDRDPEPPWDFRRRQRSKR